MKKIYSLHFVVLFFVLLISCTAFAQVYRYPKNLADQNPFARRAEIRGNSELYFVYDSLSNTSYIPNQRIFDYANIPTTAQAWQIKQRYNGAPNNNGSRHIAIASGDFNNDFKDDVVEAWEGTSQQIVITIPTIPLNLNVNGYTQITNPGPLALTSGAKYTGRIRLATGDFDGDGKSEFVIAYRNRTDLKIHLDLYDVDSATFNMTLVASIADETLPQTAIAHECFDITARDLNADGVAEIVLASAQYATNGKYKVYNKIYQTVKNPNLSILAKAKTYIDSTHVNTYSELNISVGAGDFNGDIAGEILTVYGYQGNSVPYDTWMNITRPADDSLTNPATPDWFEALRLTPKSDSALYSINDLETFCVAIGDLNKDGHDEIVVGLSDQFKAYKVDSVFNFLSIGGGSIAQNYNNVYYDSYTTLGDVNQDGKLDVINVRNSVTFGPPDYQTFYIRAHTLTGTNTFTLLANKDDIYNYTFSNTNSIRQFAITSGDFDGDRLRFRTGRHYEVADVVQPLVTLNAPPIHFDFVPDTSTTPFDVCGCFPDPVVNCPFYSTYTQATSNSLTLETKFNSDWSVSASVSTGASIGVVDVSLELEASYGQKFSKTNSSTITVKTTQGASAYFDDQYYATITVYTVWEYPVYVGDTLIGYVASFVPKSTNDLWVSATAIPDGDGFYSKHEPGHILSYRASGTVKDLNDSIFGNSGWVISQTLGPKNIGVSISEIQSSATGNTATLNLKASAKVGAFGQSVGMSGAYNYETVSTQTVSAQNDIDINTNVNNRSGVGGDYRIIPYFGWGHDGAITVDYQVDPSGPWWATYYTMQDPALLLPLHLFPEMGYTLPNPVTEYRTRTKSLTLDRRDPQRGDTVNMTVRIFNYSKTATSDSVEVRFYYGDPDHGGTLISNVQGHTSLYTNIIANQGFDSLNFRFVVQPPTGYFDHRIFAVVDPAHKITEVHENNNKGWIGMGAYFPLNLGIDELSGHGFNSFITLWQNWPNPVNDLTYMKVEVHKAGNLNINVYSTTGALVKTVVDKEVAPGEYTFSFDASKLANGIYYYTAKSAGITDTYKMVVLH